MVTEKLDAKDLAILAALDNDVRASANELGKRVRLKPETVHYRIKRLEERGIITGYYAYVYPRERHVIRKLFLRNRSLAGTEREAFITFVNANPIVSWFADTEGAYDFAITFVAKDDAQTARFTDELLTRFGKHFSERHLLISLRGTMTNEKYLVDGKYTHAHTLDYLRDLPVIDEIDDAIVRAISRNSRASYVEIGNEVGLTPEAIGYRVRALMKSGSIEGLRVRIDFAKLGLDYTHVLITLADPSVRNAVEAWGLAHPDCIFTMRHLGLYDIHLEIAASPERLPFVLDELRTRFGSSLARVETLAIRKEHSLHVLR